MSDEDKPKSFEETLRAIADEVTRGLERVQRGEGEDLAREYGIDADRAKRFMDTAGDWLRSQADTFNVGQSESAPAPGRSESRPADTPWTTFPSGAGPDPLDVPSDDQDLPRPGDRRPRPTRFGWTPPASTPSSSPAGERSTSIPIAGRHRALRQLLQARLRARAGHFRCLVDQLGRRGLSRNRQMPHTMAPSGDNLRTYRLALAATVEYSDFHSAANPPLKSDVMNNGSSPA